MERNPSMAELFKRQSGGCFHCAGWMDPLPRRSMPNGAVENPNGYTREHLVPRSKGGVTVGNIVLAHFSCNTCKGDRMPTEQELARLRKLYAGVTLDLTRELEAA